MITTIHTKHIEAIAVTPIRHDPLIGISFLSEIKKTWYRSGRKAGYYRSWLFGGDGIYIGPEIPYNTRSQFLKDGHVFYKPKVTFRLGSGDKYEYYFDTLDEAETFAHNAMLSGTIRHGE